MSLKTFLYGLFVVLLWASTTVIGRFLVAVDESIHPMQIAFLRYLFGGVGLYVIATFSGKQKLDTVRNYPQKERLIITGLIASLFPVLLFYGVMYTSAIASGVLLNGNTVFIVAFSLLFLSERLTKMGWAGVTIATTGMVLVIMGSSGTVSLAVFTQGSFLGNTLSLLAGLDWAVFTVLLKAWFSKTDPLEMMTFSIIFGSLVLLPVTLIVAGLSIVWTIDLIILLVIIGFGATSVGFFFYLLILNEETAIVTGAIQLAVPVVATILSILFLSEDMNVYLFIGLVMVLVGLYWTNNGVVEMAEQEDNIPPSLHR